MHAPRWSPRMGLLHKPASLWPGRAPTPSSGLAGSLPCTRGRTPCSCLRPSRWPPISPDPRDHSLNTVTPLVTHRLPPHPPLGAGGALLSSLLGTPLPHTHRQCREIPHPPKDEDHTSLQKRETNSHQSNQRLSSSEDPGGQALRATSKHQVTNGLPGLLRSR